MRTALCAGFQHEKIAAATATLGCAGFATVGEREARASDLQNRRLGSGCTTKTNKNAPRNIGALLKKQQIRN
jgi:hypothetical protein